MPKTNEPIFVVLENVLSRRSITGQPIGPPVRGAQKFLARLAQTGRVSIWSERVGAAYGSSQREGLHRDVREWLAKHEFPVNVQVLFEFPQSQGVFIGPRTIQCRPMQKDNGELLPEFAFDDAVFETEKLLGLEDPEA